MKTLFSVLVGLCLLWLLFHHVVLEGSVQSTFQPNPEEKKALPDRTPRIMQMPELPRGCEVTSLAMMLGHAGIQVSKMELAQKIPKVPFRKNEWKGNMHQGFVGDMYSLRRPGLGVFVEPITQLADRYLPDRIIQLTGKEPKDLYQMIEYGRPVWVLTNVTYRPLPDSAFETWKTEQGKQKVTYFQHSVVLVGYDDQFVYFHDPLGRVTKAERVDFEKAWIQIGRQAISYR